MTGEKGAEASLGIRFRSFIRDEDLLPGNESTLLGVSGGIDSMVMAALFKESLLPFAIAHCNFRLRGEEADRDEDLVR
ncbi:MAG: hypothetical protein MUE32_08835, partial [Bacteroidales bacterium]|nr:hypothetical protein [Bacteroidales bacterium]